MVTPLPTALRNDLAVYLGEKPVDRKLSLSILSEYDMDSADEVKTAGSIGYYGLMNTLGNDNARSLEKLSKDIVCYGFNYEARRRAAFIGLVLLDRLDIMINAVEVIGDEKECRIPIAESFRPNNIFVDFVLKKWMEIRNELGEEIFYRLRKWESEKSLMDALCSLADRSSEAYEEIIDRLQKNERKQFSANILRFLERVKPKSKILLDFCLAAMGIGEGDDSMVEIEPIVAAEILGKNYGGSEEVLRSLLDKLKVRPYDPAVLIALCEGWPEENELKEQFKKIIEKDIKLPHATIFSLIGLYGKPENVRSKLNLALDGSMRLYSMDLPYVVGPIVKRISKDDVLEQILWEELKKSTSTSIKATYPRMLAASRRRVYELTEWCKKEISRQLESDEGPEIGLDLMFGELRPVVHSLLDILY